MVTNSGAAATNLSVALALGLWLAALAPQWILLVWGVKHLDSLREAVARRFGWKLLAAGCWIASILLAFVGTVFVCRDVLGPDRLGMQRIVSTSTLVLQVLLVVVGLVLVSRRRRARTVASDGGELTRSR